MISRRIPLALIALAPIACGAEPEARFAASYAATESMTESTPDAIGAALSDAPPGDDKGAIAAQASGETAPPASQPRKIIYNADVALTVADLDESADRLDAAVEAVGGYLSNSDVQGSPGNRRSGNWTARIPADRFRAFLDALSALGEPTRERVDSRDVTEEFYDLDARLKNKGIEEDRLLQLLEEATASLKDTLDVERELSRVREEIERMQGRLRYLSDQTSLSTVTIALFERDDYTPAEAPGFGTRVARTFRGSVDSLREFGERTVLFAAAVLPWIPVIALALLILRWLVRRRWTRRAASLPGA